MIVFRSATEADATRLAATLRQQDSDECYAAFGKPEIALPYSVGVSTQAICVSLDGEPLAIFGWLAEGLSARVWMLGSSTLTDDGRTYEFLAASREWVGRLNDAFPLLWNIIDSRNTAHIRWLRWLGFTFINKEPAGPLGLPFYTFVRIKQSCVSP